MKVEPWMLSSIEFASLGLGEIYFDSDLFFELRWLRCLEIRGKISFG